MPEIPEIETVRVHLEHKVQGQAIEQVIVNREKALNVPVAEFSALTTGRQITTIRRRAKQIIISLGQERSLIVHFMLEGHVRLLYPGEEPAGKPTVMLMLNSGQRLAFFKLNLGYLHLVPTVNLTAMPELAGLGPEPLAADFTLKKFLELLAPRKGMIKPLLLDQAFIAGIGNVYSNEALFCSRIRPERKASHLTAAERQQLYHCIRAILTEAIKFGGVYEEKFASDDNFTGGFEPYLQVAYRTGRPCTVCSHLIETKRVGGRNAFYCPVCQK
ncbi:bifunctional DNA-formamidopyrimidine glycosylase/DNA-(apurinic or apyrimidinic site) lyase [Sporomusa termitida]|uniref:Formamidopyrimidine-DNA glycosylase n=1 Tax=Sporomusa termitida TaxID=2377 RepID=A0A517DRM6_9FIRM|nr:bifunctional DNA-formamidopyrimidine glycosylase/DNA-(apurinic or apyrimidinic site) lyase [Sporomusa termitida]QDR80015.1 Formamidopyrimidine-DNA glycosylase [Sporomusa termitida]